MSVPRVLIDETALELMSYLEHKFGPRRVGMTLFVFDMEEADRSDGGYLGYISNAKRESMIAAVKEWLALQEAGLTTDPAGPRAEG